MLGRNMLLAVGAVIAGLLVPAQAMAQYEAITRTDLNLRVGPGTNYGVIDVIPGGYPVEVLGCLDDLNWCDVDWDGLRGWVSASYLVQPGTRVYLPQVAPRIGVPIISFSFGAYHDRHYRDRPWHRQRSGRWRGRDYRDGRPGRRQETRRPGRPQESDRPSRPGRPQESGRPSRQESGRPSRQESGRPSGQESGRPSRQESGRPSRQESGPSQDQGRGEVTQRPRQGDQDGERSQPLETQTDRGQ